MTPLPYNLDGVSEESLSALDIRELRAMCQERGIQSEGPEASVKPNPQKGNTPYDLLRPT